MKVKVGDQVKIIAGKDKGKEGKIIKTLRKEDRVVVEGINIVKKHLKPRCFSIVLNIMLQQIKKLELNLFSVICFHF